MENMHQHEFGKYVINKNKILMVTYWYISDDLSLPKFISRGYLEDNLLVIKYRPCIFKPREDTIYHKVKL